MSHKCFWSILSILVEIDKVLLIILVEQTIENANPLIITLGQFLQAKFKLLTTEADFHLYTFDKIAKDLLMVSKYLVSMNPLVHINMPFIFLHEWEFSFTSNIQNGRHKNS